MTKQELEQWKLVLRILKQQNDETLEKLRAEEEEREDEEYGE